MKKIVLLVIACIFLNNSISIAKEYLSKNPNYIKRGMFGKVYIANYLKKEIDKHNYKIIEDPTGKSPIKIIESFSPRKGDCGNQKHWNGSITDCNSSRLRLEIVNQKENRLSSKNIKNKPLERWYGFYFYVPNNFPQDENLNPYINQFYGYNKNWNGGGPFISTLLWKGSLKVGTDILINKNDLKGKWHKIEYHFKWSTKKDGFMKVYHNDNLKINRQNILTFRYDFMEIKYGTYTAKYSHVSSDYEYPKNYQFPSHTIYFAGFSEAKKRNKLIINKKNIK